jgi:hypothetical protein
MDSFTKDSLPQSKGGRHCSSVQPRHSCTEAEVDVGTLAQAGQNAARRRFPVLDRT